MTKFHPSILKKYDIRGIYGETLTEEDAYHWGYLFTHYLKLKKPKKVPKIAVGYDTRHSSPTLKSSMIEGIIDAGGHAIDVGMGPTPYLYYSTKLLRTQGGIMITGSHNPPKYNGFKTLTSQGPVSGDLIKEIASLSPSENMKSGKSTTAENYGAYLIEIMAHASLTPFSGKNVVWDAGNGACGNIIDLFIQTYGGSEHIPLFTEPNGDFPHHHPDPSDVHNYTLLIQKMKESAAKIGFLFDGDADRVGVVLEGGHILLADQMIGILALDYLKKWQSVFGNKIILDVKASQFLVELIEKHGGKVIFAPTGHSLIKEKMKEENAGFAGEISGHIFYKHNHNFDDGLLTAQIFLRIFTTTPELIDQVLNSWPKNYLSPEIRIPFDLAQRDVFFKNLEKEADMLNMTILKIDGIRVSNEKGWFLIRASNTEPLLSLRVEGESEEFYLNLWKTLQNLIQKSGGNFQFDIPASC